MDAKLVIVCPGDPRGGDCGAVLPANADFCPWCERTFTGSEIHNLLDERGTSEPGTLSSRTT